MGDEVMTVHENKTCPRCGKPFECKVGSITLCQCYSVELSLAETEYVKAKYDDCICVNCLEALKGEYRSMLEARE
jgi:hypothetical protein